MYVCMCVFGCVYGCMYVIYVCVHSYQLGHGSTDSTSHPTWVRALKCGVKAMAGGVCVRVCVCVCACV